MAKDNKKKGGSGDEGGDEGGDGKPKLKSAHSIEVRHILCEKFSKKEQALSKIRDENLSFDEVAKDFSEDKARQGGYLGWRNRSEVVPEFAEVAFQIEQSECKSPVIGEAQSVFGYHIIMVHGRK